MQILVVDDSKAMRMIVIRELKRAGYSSDDIVEADSGKTALECVSGGEIDLIVSDWNMPEMSGIELLQALRETGWTKPFGFVTTESADSAYNQALGSGANFLIGKPFTGDTLATEIGKALAAAG
ncbi:MAG TPA: response regulator [Acidimicrobiales bacterium]|nr:response regulator [Acidimicrobiales bacterium]